jgi:hypothetical protein
LRRGRAAGLGCHGFGGSILPEVLDGRHNLECGRPQVVVGGAIEASAAHSSVASGCAFCLWCPASESSFVVELRDGCGWMDRSETSTWGRSWFFEVLGQPHSLPSAFVLDLGLCRPTSAFLSQCWEDGIMWVTRSCSAGSALRPSKVERADWDTTSKCHARRLGGSALTPARSHQRCGCPKTIQQIRGTPG